MKRERERERERLMCPVTWTNKQVARNNETKEKGSLEYGGKCSAHIQRERERVKPQKERNCINEITGNVTVKRDEGGANKTCVRPTKGSMKDGSVVWSKERERMKAI
jgi:hypothetical protein